MLKKIDRTLLEVETGVLFWTALAVAAGFVLPLPAWGLSRTDWCAGTIAAGILVMIAMAHMQSCLDRGLSLEEAAASKVIVRGYLIRYVAIAVILVVATVTEVLNPLILCLGYLLIMKVAAYSQPITHKFYNKLFHETDPIPEPLVEEEEVIK